jgi:hypothetical protein
VTYGLDLTQVRLPSSAGEYLGYPVFQAQEFAAFPIDLATRDKKVDHLDWDTVARWPSKARCAGLPTDRDYLSDDARGESAIALTAPDDKLKGFRSPYHVRLRQVELDTPHRGTFTDAGRRPVDACLVVRTTGPGGEWRWRTRRFELTREVSATRVAATLDLDVADVDAVAILFEAGLGVDRIRYTIEQTSAGTPGAGPPVATSACCDACADSGPTLASRYCCTARAPAPEPCFEDDLPVAPSCRPYGELHDAAAAACRARGAWLRDVSTRDTARECPPAPNELESGLSRRAHFKCCRDPYFVPQPPDRQSPLPDCMQVGGLWSPCASHEDMLDQAVKTCFMSGLTHRSITFKDDCGPGGAGMSTSVSVCCRPGAAGPPTNYCGL